MKKTAFFELFARCPAKSVRKQCFFHVFRNTLYKVSKKCEKQRFWSFLGDVPQKVWENSIFRRFTRHSVKSSQKCKKQRFLCFLRDILQEVWENSVFSRISRHCVQLSEKILTNSIFWAFSRCPAKSVRKQCFFIFFETLCTKFAKKAKKSVFWAFCTLSHKKCEKTVFFHVF